MVSQGPRSSRLGFLYSINFLAFVIGMHVVSPRLPDCYHRDHRTSCVSFERFGRLQFQESAFLTGFCSLLSHLWVTRSDDSYSPSSDGAGGTDQI